MAGLAAGSACIGRWGQHDARPIVRYAQLGFLVSATGALSLAGLAGDAFALCSRLSGGDWVAAASARTEILWRGRGSIHSYLFDVAATFPISRCAGALRLAFFRARYSSQLALLGRTLGAVAGTLISGFVLLPAFGFAGHHRVCGSP